MNRRNIILAAISALVLLVAIAFSLGLFSTEPSLTVHLRCDKNVSGKLSVAMISSNGKAEKKKSFDLKTVCKAGEIDLDNYQKETNLWFELQRDTTEGSTLISEYGRDIHSDRNGFYMVLKIKNAPPFIANDRL